MGLRPGKCHSARAGIGLLSWWPEAEKDKEKRQGREGERQGKRERGDRDRQMRQGKPRTRCSSPNVTSDPLFQLARPLVFTVVQYDTIIETKPSIQEPPKSFHSQTQDRTIKIKSVNTTYSQQGNNALQCYSHSKTVYL